VGIAQALTPYAQFQTSLVPQQGSNLILIIHVAKQRRFERAGRPNHVINFNLLV